MHIHASQEKEGLDKEISWKFRYFLLGLGQNGPKNAESAGFAGHSTLWLFVDCVVVACIFSLLAGTAAPDVNESHYLTKAKHFWDPDFASRDLFLASADAHWFFFATVGSLTHVASLPVAAWCGRMIGWLAIAVGWCLFIRRFSDFRLAGITTAPLWIAGLYWGQLSGEWVIGGCEAKVFAYACSFIGLSEMVSNRWSRAWVWFGLGAAFHVLTGGWITLAALVTYAVLKLRVESRWFKVRTPAANADAAAFEPEPLKFQWLGLIIGGSLSLLGLIPAVMLNRGIDAATSERGAMIYVFQRLAHHLSPLRFASERWAAFGVLAAITIVFTWLCYRSWGMRNGRRKSFDPLLSLIIVTTIVSLIAIAGVLIDIGFSSWATNWSATLLRFYWFRWNDVIWPTLLVVVTMMLAKNAFASGFCPSLPAGPDKNNEPQALAALENTGVSNAASACGSRNRKLFVNPGALPEDGARGGRSSGDFREHVVRWLAILMLAIPGPLLIAVRYLENNRANLAPADRASLVMRTESASTQMLVRDDWLDVCHWIRANTPKDSLFLTPRFQQTFKWYAHRAEVASWKDAPQDALGLIEWEKRMLEIFPRSAEGYGISMSDQHFRQMRLRYKVDYVVVDRRIQKQPPLLSLVHSNSTYAVFEFLD